MKNSTIKIAALITLAVLSLASCQKSEVLPVTHVDPPIVTEPVIPPPVR